MKNYHPPGYHQAYYWRNVEQRRRAAVAVKRRRWARWVIREVLEDLNKAPA